MSGTSIVPSSTDSQKNHNRIIAWITGLLTLSVATFAFTLSFNSLADLAAQHQVSIPILFPMIVEAGVVIFSLNALYRSLHGERAIWQWGLIIASSFMAGIFNVLHAPPKLISQFIAAMPSLFLLLAFETFLGQIKYAVSRGDAVRSLAELQTEIENQRSAWDTERSEFRTLVQNEQQNLERLQGELSELRVELDGLEEQRNSLRTEIARLLKQKGRPNVSSLGSLNEANEIRADKKHQAQQALLDFYEQHPNASLAEAGEAIGRAKSTVANYLEELGAAGRIVRNGDGWEVCDVS